MAISSQNVLDAFDSFGDKSVHNQALQAALRDAGYEIGEIVIAINVLINSGTLLQDGYGAISRS